MAKDPEDPLDSRKPQRDRRTRSKLPRQPALRGDPRRKPTSVRIPQMEKMMPQMAPTHITEKTEKNVAKKATPRERERERGKGI
jgi:hypothetical protein